MAWLVATVAVLGSTVMVGASATAQSGADESMTSEVTVGDELDPESIGTITTYFDLTDFPTRNTDFPFDITLGPDGNLWYSASGSNRIGYITPGGAFTTFPLPFELSQPEWITVGADGNLWFTSPPLSNVGRITPTGDVTVFDDPAFGRAVGLTTGPDGNLWMTQSNGDIVRFDPDTEQATVFTDDAFSFIFEGNIKAGPDGNLWFVDYGQDQIGRIDPDTGDIQLYTDNGNVDGPFEIAPGPGGDLWFTSYDNDRIGRIDPDTGDIQTYTDPTNALHGPVAITAGPDGNVWFTSDSTHIGRLTPTGAMNLYQTSPAVGGRNIVAGPDDAVWFTDPASDRIGRASTVAVLGSITIVEDSEPDHGRDFAYTTSGNGLSAFSLDDDADPMLPSSRSFSGLSAGNYTVSQAAVPGWRLRALTCDTGESPSVAGRSVSIHVAAGEQVHCTFTNARHRPDLSIKVGTGAYVGEGVYSSVASATQKVTSSVRAGATKTLRVRLRNDGAETDVIRLSAASTGSAGYTVRYLRADNNADITGYVTGANGNFTLAPGATLELKVKVTAARTSARGSSRTVTVTARSTMVGGAVDVVRAKVTRT